MNIHDHCEHFYVIQSDWIDNGKLQTSATCLQCGSRNIPSIILELQDFIKIENSNVFNEQK